MTSCPSQLEQATFQNNAWKHVCPAGQSAACPKRSVPPLRPIPPAHSGFPALLSANLLALLPLSCDNKTGLQKSLTAILRRQRCFSPSSTLRGGTRWETSRRTSPIGQHPRLPYLSQPRLRARTTSRLPRQGGARCSVSQWGRCELRV